MRYEYKIFELKISPMRIRNESFEEELNKIGNDGWEVMYMEQRTWWEHFVVCKRQLK